MMKLHTLALCLGVFIQAAGAWVHPAFTARVGASYVHTPGQPVLFDDVVSNDGNLYNRVTRTYRAPGDGIYWITLNTHPAQPKMQVYLLLNVNGENKFYSFAYGIPSSKSGAFFLRYGFNLTVTAEGIHPNYLGKDTLWSVVYISWGAQAFLGQFNGKFAWQDPVSFPELITRLNNNNIYQESDSREFIILADGLYLVHLSAVGDHNLTLVLQKQVPWLSFQWIDILETTGGKGPKPSSVDAVFDLLRYTRLRVVRPQDGIGLPWNGTVFSIVGFGSTDFANTTAFTGETRPLVRGYAPNEPVKFDVVRININNNYDTSTGIFTVPYDLVYVVSLRPKAAEAAMILYKPDGKEQIQTVTGRPLTFALRNATHEVFRVTTDYWVPAGVSVGLRLRAGDKLKVFAETPDVNYTGVKRGSLFSIASLYLCCNFPPR